MLSFLIHAALGAVLLTSAAPEDADIIAAQLPTYPLETCPISGEAFGGDMGDPINLVHEGQFVRLCCKGCIKDFNKDPAPTLAMIKQAVIEAQTADYPLDTCVVSGEALGGDMGDPIDHVIGTRLVRLCCKGCVKKVNADPGTYMAALDAAYIQAQLATYPLDTCVVSGETLVEEDTIDMLYGNQLVRLCCAPCKKKIRATPDPFLAAIAKAMPARMPEHTDHRDGHGDEADGHSGGDGHSDDGGHGEGDEHSGHDH